MLENYFAEFRKNVIGIDQEFDGPYGKKKIIYADWTASGRLYKPIEERLLNDIGPFVGNTHTGTTITGKRMTDAYHYALKYIKKHVNAGNNDVIISSNSGMTGVVNKFQRILGLKLHENFQRLLSLSSEERPLVLVTHMEHHSNQTSWMETIADVVVIPSDANGLVDLTGLHTLLHRFYKRKVKIAAVTSYSNVTGISTPYHEIAEIMHLHKGLCFVDFACAAPYITIDMHPPKEGMYLDAIYFSPHKFLGGPGGTGILIFNSELYRNKIPDCPGGGTVEWTNPWGGHKYVDDIELREDGGTPAFLQTIKVALAIKLKEQMGVDKMLQRENEMLSMIWPALEEIPNLHLLAGNSKDRLGVISFYIDKLHYNLAVKILNDKYGIQTRGGCSCAGTYGHILLHVDIDTSKIITEKISHGDLSLKPGWIRMSIHPIMKDSEIGLILKAIKELSQCHLDIAKEYVYDEHSNEFHHISEIKGINNWANTQIDSELI
jgi:selenocysteine lyase/cysteine desulfurase